MAAASIMSNASPNYLYYRHTLPVRIMHWTNFIALTLLFMSGLHIFNAHSALYWGDSSYSGRPPLLQITTRDGGAGERVGVTRVFGREFETTGLLGLSKYPNGEPNAHAFPSWLTIPGGYSLAMARDWHFFFAWIFVLNGVAYVLYSIVQPSPDARSDANGQRAAQHRYVDRRSCEVQASERRSREALQRAAKARLPERDFRSAAIGDPGRMGDVAMAELHLSRLGRPVGRPTIGAHDSFHRCVAAGPFLAVHVFEVIISGFWNHIRSMITGRYRIKMGA